MDTVDHEKNARIIEDICVHTVIGLKKQGLSSSNDDFMLEHCGEIMQRVSDPDIRSMHIMAE